MRRLIALGVLSVAFLLGGTMYLIIAEGGSSSSGDSDEPNVDFDAEREIEAETPSDSDSDSDLDALYDDCDDGSMTACDDLYWQSPLGSDYEDFGSTCGDRERATRGGCA